MDEVDSALNQSPRKNAVRNKHKTSVGSRISKMLSKYKMKLDFRCNGTRFLMHVRLSVKNHLVLNLGLEVQRCCT